MKYLVFLVSDVADIMVLYGIDFVIFRTKLYHISICYHDIITILI